jgi:myo-inositol 2-dehydrogenase / D-chiro-inositol 1-dehydrogenase
LKVGIIGTGWFSKTHSRILAEISGVDVTAFCGTNLEKAESAAKEWSSAKGYTNVEEMLDQQKLDAVYICVPPMAHGEIEHALIKRNIPFFVEKPLGIKAEPFEIARKIEEKALITSVGYQWRYKDTTEKAMSFLQNRRTGMAMGYWMGTMPMVPWWRDVNQSGGQMLEQTTHIIDLLRYLCGEINEVYAAYGKQVMADKVEGTTVPDVGSVILKLNNGLVANISNTCILPESNKVGLEIYTDKGVLALCMDSLKDTCGKRVSEFKDQQNPYIIESSIFIDAVRTGDSSKILSPYHDAVKTHRVTTAAAESALTGKPITLSSEAE